tara:strand:- start:553 stop:1089 length:537 start_codon:yes stop_codon:yes gene_type:complete
MRKHPRFESLTDQGKWQAMYGDTSNQPQEAQAMNYGFHHVSGTIDPESLRKQMRVLEARVTTAWGYEDRDLMEGLLNMLEHMLLCEPAGKRKPAEGYAYARDYDWSYWANPETEWDSGSSDDSPCYTDIIEEAEARGWTGDNGWESSDDPDDDQSELADANEEAALEYIWASIKDTTA